MSISSSDDERILGRPFDARREQVLRDAQPVVDAVIRSSTVRRYMNQLIDQLVGSVSVPQMQGAGEAMRSPAAWNLLAARQQEGQDVRIVRFMEQFAAMMQGFQKKLCDKESIDQDALACASDSDNRIFEGRLKIPASIPDPFPLSIIGARCDSSEKSPSMKMSCGDSGWWIAYSGCRRYFWSTC